MAEMDFSSLMADVSAPGTTDTTVVDKTVDITAQADATQVDTETHVDADVDHTAADVDANLTDEQKAEAAKADADKKDPTPTKVQAALKALRDSSPENAEIARKLKDVYAQHLSYSKVFPKVADALAAKTTIESIGGPEGIAKLQQTIASVNETDQALYSGSKDVVSSLYEDTVTNGHPEAFSKLAPHFLDILATKDPTAYSAVMNPLNLKFLDSVNFPGVVNALGDLLDGGDTDKAYKLVKEMARWYNEFSEKNKKTTQVNPEAEAWRKEKEEFQTSQKQAFQQGLAKSAMTENQNNIVKSLQPYIKGNPYFKGWTKVMYNDMGRNINNAIMSELKKDTSYQAQMKALYSVPKPNQDEIIRYHKSVVELKTPQIVKTVLDRDYAGYAKTRAAVRTTATDKTKTQDQNKDNVASTSAVSVLSEPKRDEIDWTRDPQGVLYTTNKAYIKKTGQLVQWSRKK